MRTASRALARYKAFVRANPLQVQVLESCVQSVLFLLPSRFGDETAQSEIVYAVSRLFNLYNERIIVDGAEGAEGVEEGGDRRLQTLRALLSVLAIVDLPAEKVAAGFGEGKRDAVILTVETLRAVCRVLILAVERDVLVDGGALRTREAESLPLRAAGPPAAAADAAASAGANASAAGLSFTGGRSGRVFPLPERYSALGKKPQGSPRAQDPGQASAGRGRAKAAKSGAVAPEGAEKEEKVAGAASPAPAEDEGAEGRPQEAKEEEPEAPEPEAPGREAPGPAQEEPSPRRAARPAPAPAPSLLGQVGSLFRALPAAFPSSKSSAIERSEALTLLGELLFLLRPLLFAVLERAVVRRRRRRLGSGSGSALPAPNQYGSWALLGLSFACDAVAAKSSEAGAYGRQMELLGEGLRVGEAAGAREELLRRGRRDAERAEELRRRKALWVLYLLRSPLFKLLTEPTAKAAAGAAGRVPLLGGAARYALQLLLHVQRHHFYTSGSA